MYTSPSMHVVYTRLFHDHVAGVVTYTGSVYFDVNRTEGTSVELQAETDVENATLQYQLESVDDPQQADFVSLTSDGILTVLPNAAVGTFFIDVSFKKSRLFAVSSSKRLFVNSRLL